MSRFSNFRSRASRGFSRARSGARRFGGGARRTYASKTMGVKNSTLMKLAILGVGAYYFKDKLKPLIDSIIKPKTK